MKIDFQIISVIQQYCIQGKIWPCFLPSPSSAGEFKSGQIQVFQIISLKIQVCLDKCKTGETICKWKGIKITFYTVDNRFTQDVICCLQNKVQDELVRVQPGFKSELLTSVEVFQKDVTDFGTSYDTVSNDAKGSERRRW